MALGLPIGGVKSAIDGLHFQVQKGFFFNATEKLFLKFHFNPHEIEINKSPNYEETNIPLYPTKLITWGGNEAKQITFDLFFDATDSTATFTPNPRRRVGVMGIEAVLESFMLPASSRKANMETVQEVKSFIKGLGIGDSVLQGGLDPASLLSQAQGVATSLYESVTAPFSNPSKFFSNSSQLEDSKDKNYSSSVYAPPDCYFVYGSRWFKTKLKSASFKETNFNRSLTPRQLNVGITLHVIEDGEFAQYMDTMRETLAKGESETSQSEMRINILSASIANAADQVAAVRFAIQSGDPSAILNASQSVIEMPLGLNL